MTGASYQQAGIEIQAKELFSQLRGALERVFAPARVEQFLRKLENKGIRIRDLDAVLAKQVFEQLDEQLRAYGKSARLIYMGLPVSDQAQFRELYLTALEAVDQGLREKYAKLYRYY